ncbi:MAG: hypothetical protein KDD70_02980 [Bdellovibrionales bacterium]|nr:hypothetical protein [Bdellovibrionales bacterium]
MEEMDSTTYSSSENSYTKSAQLEKVPLLGKVPSTTSHPEPEALEYQTTSEKYPVLAPEGNVLSNDRDETPRYPSILYSHQSDFAETKLRFFAENGDNALQLRKVARIILEDGYRFLLPESNSNRSDSRAAPTPEALQRFIKKTVDEGGLLLIGMLGRELVAVLLVKRIDTESDGYEVVALAHNWQKLVHIIPDIAHSVPLQGRSRYMLRRIRSSESKLNSTYLGLVSINEQFTYVLLSAGNENSWKPNRGSSAN